MFPDFPKVKAKARRAFQRAVRNQILRHAPLLGQISHHRVHEGNRGRLTRHDGSEDPIGFEESRAEFEIPREQMKSITVEQLMEHVSLVAEQFAGQQMTLLFSRVGEAVESVGNVVSATELGNREAFLEMQRRLEVDFDVDTLEPRNQMIVLHPNQLDGFLAQMREWESDPTFVAELERIREAQLEAWRAREDSRRLVD